MYDLQCFASLNSGPVLVVVLQSVLLVYGTVVAGQNGTSPGAKGEGIDRASRDVRFLTALETGSDVYDANEFSLYPVEWNGADDTGSRHQDGSELEQLLEGGASDGGYHLGDVPEFASTHRDGDEVLRLFNTVPSEFGSDGIKQRELFVGTFTQGQSDISSDLPLTGPRTSSHTSPSPDQTEDMLVMAASSPLTRVSEFFRGMWQSVGERQSTGLSGSIQRLIPHRFRPHFVNTSKGLRNIPHQLNDGQLQLAPEDALAAGSPTSNGAQSNGVSSANTKPTGSSSPIGSLFNSFKRKLKAIYPGTVWCGDGNQAKSEDDIGFFYLTDSCCRAHDLCPITIAAGEQFNRLKNNGHFTRSHCDCDKKFYNCLKNANTLVSRQIGYTYFNLLKPQCFRHEHPKLNCTKRSRGKCLTYVVDETQPKQWQWFDNLIY